MPGRDPTLGDVQSLIAAGKPAEARAALALLMRRNPRSPGPLILASQLAAADGDHESSLRHADAAIAASPNDPAALRARAAALVALRRNAESVEAWTALVTLEPADAGAAISLANALLHDDRLDEAEAALEAALARRPDVPRLWHERAGMLLATGRAADAVAVLERALARHPRDAATASFLASTLNYVPGVDPARVRAAHERFARLIEPESLPVSFANPRDPARPLRVGYISPDLHKHSIAYFLLPLLERHDPNSIAFTLYRTGTKSDAFTERFRRLAETAPNAWRECAGLSDTALCRQIRRDGIDILVELSGHTTGHSLGALALRPAPVIISAIGYPHDTGLRAIRLRLGDRATDPPSTAPDGVLRLPRCFLCYRPPDDAPEPEPLDLSRPPTFGSFNALQKHGDDLLALWARLLHATPGSRLVMKGDMRLTAVASRLRRTLESHAIDPARLTLLSNTPTPEEARLLYRHVDVALDTFPYNGTTTTCEALWMGVPVVTLRGSAHASRVSSSLLETVGLPELVASTPDEYVEIARTLVLDRPRVSKLRRTLRARVAGSPLCDAAAYARAVEDAYRLAWSEWCADPR